MYSVPKLEAVTSETTMPTSSPGYTPPASGTLRPWALSSHIMPQFPYV